MSEILSVLKFLLVVAVFFVVYRMISRSGQLSKVK